MLNALSRWLRKKGGKEAVISICGTEREKKNKRENIEIPAVTA